MSAKQESNPAVYCEEVPDPSGAFIRVWEGKAPPDGSEWVVDEQEWQDVRVQRIKAWHPKT